jgi:hypothetical protein
MKILITNFLPLFLLVFTQACQKEDPVISMAPKDVTVIGPEGGTVLSSDGLLKLEVPPNSTTNKVSIKIIEGSIATPTFKNANKIGKTYVIEPSGTRFSKPINIEVNYKNYLSQIGKTENLSALHFGTGDDKFIETLSIENNTEDNVLNFTIDHFSALAFDHKNYDEGWAVHDFFWTIPVLKWYLETPVDYSYLNETNIQFALDLWDKETDSFRFERTYDKAQANIRFEEVYVFDGLYDDINYYFTEKTRVGSTSFDFSTWVIERKLEADNYAKIKLASNEFDSPDEDENIVRARKTIAHEIGHALGIAHTVKETLPYPVMRSGHDPIQLWNEKLHEWDINALHVNYKIAEPELVLVKSWLFQDTDTKQSRYEKLSFDGSVLWASEYHTRNLVAINIDDNLTVKTRIPDPTVSLSEYGFQPQFGLTWDGNNFWSCDGAGTGSYIDTVGVNPGAYIKEPYPYINTGKIYKHANDGDLTVLTEFPAPGPFPFALAWDGASLWCFDNYENKIYKLAANGSIATSYEVKGFRQFSFETGEIYDLAWDGTSFWAVTWLTNRIYRCGIVGNTFMPIKSYETILGEPRIGIEWANGYLYVVNYNRIYKDFIAIDKYRLE